MHRAAFQQLRRDSHYRWRCSSRCIAKLDQKMRRNLSILVEQQQPRRAEILGQIKRLIVGTC